MKVKFKCPMFHQGTFYEKGLVYELDESELKAIDKNDYVKYAGEDEVSKPRRTTKEIIKKDVPKSANSK